jgi:glycerophosphoryl diester phosphodiesterase
MRPRLILICGNRGSGKTHLGWEILKNSPADLKVIVDVNNEFNGNIYPSIQKWKAAKSSPIFRLGSWRLPEFVKITRIEEAEIIFEELRPEKSGQSIEYFVTEYDLITSNSRIKQRFNFYNEIVQRGRHINCSLIANARLIQDVDKYFIANADHHVFFKTGNFKALKYLKECLPEFKGLVGNISNLGLYEKIVSKAPATYRIYKKKETPDF